MGGLDFTVYKGSESGEIVKARGHREVGPTEVLVDITHCGVCGTDEHYKHADMGLGHEGVGVIREVGQLVPQISEFKVGDRVGLGYMQKFCGYCDFCISGHSTKCAKAQGFGISNLDQGSFGTGAAWDVSAIVKIPDEVASEHAGPLMCGGITVWAPLYENDIKPASRIGIVGIGGLGHLAIQFASKLGHDVVVFSSTESKKEEALKFGASEFHATKGVTEFKIKPLDHLIITTSVLPDLLLFFQPSVLNPLAEVFPLTVDFSLVPVPLSPMLLYNYSIVGSGGGYMYSFRKMMEFVARTGIKPQIEKFPMSKDGIEQAMKKLADGNVRYRGVLAA